MRGLFAPLFESRGWRNPDPVFREAIVGEGESASGVHVTERRALGVPAVWACVSLLADNVAMLPIVVSKKVGGSNKRPDPGHALYTLLHDLPNPEMTAVELQGAMQGHLALWGNAYAEVEYDALGRIRGLWPLRPDTMQLTRDSEGNRVFLYRLPDGRPVKWTWRDAAHRPSPILHIRGLGSDGWAGYSVLSLARNEMGLSIAAADHAGRLFKNGSRPGGVLQAPTKLDPKTAKAVKDAWELAHRGLDNAHRVAVLESGVTWQQVGINPDDAQLLETRRFERAEIASLFRIPPHMIGDTDRSTSWGTGIEAQQIGFYKMTLMPWCTRWCQAIARDLLTLKGWSTHEITFDLDEYLKADIKTRYDAFQLARQNGVMSADEWRARENMDPIADGHGGEYWRPSNMVVVGATPDGPGDDGEGKGASDGRA